MDATSRVKALYYIMQSMEGKLGGGEGVEGLYGSITRSGMQKVLDCLSASCGLTKDSHLVDIGAGLGRPLMHALVYPGVASGFGIEIDRIKCDKAAAFLKHTIKELKHRIALTELPVPRVQCSSIEKVASLEPATHAYSFWEGVPTEGKCAFGRLFAQCRSMQSVAVVQRAMRGRDPAQEMEEMGFGALRLMASFPVSMSGSGRSFTAYVFNRVQPILAAVEKPGPCSMQPLTPAAAEGRRESLESSATQAPAELLRRTDGNAQMAQQAVATATDQQAAELEVLPHTPAAQQEGRPMLTASLTPLTARKAISEHSSTPKSAGISGPARRVPTAKATAEGVADMKPSTWPIRQIRRAGAGTSLSLQSLKDSGEKPRRSTRAKPATKQVGQTTGSAASPKKNGVQKPRSPAKKTLEAAGFRSRRAAAMGFEKGGRLAKAEKDRVVVLPRGLGRLTDAKV